MKVLNDRMIGALPMDTVENPKLNLNSISSVLFACSCPQREGESQCASTSPIQSVQSKSISNKLKMFQKTKNIPKIHQVRCQSNKLKKHQKTQEPETTFKDEFKALHLELHVL